jgi:hypothetical protein
LEVAYSMNSMPSRPSGLASSLNEACRGSRGVVRDGQQIAHGNPFGGQYCRRATDRRRLASVVRVAEEFQVGRDHLEQHVGAHLHRAAARLGGGEEGVISVFITTSPTKVRGSSRCHVDRQRIALGSCPAAWR